MLPRLGMPGARRALMLHNACVRRCRLLKWTAKAVEPPMRLLDLGLRGEE